MFELCNKCDDHVLKLLKNDKETPFGILEGTGRKEGGLLSGTPPISFFLPCRKLRFVDTTTKIYNVKTEQGLKDFQKELRNKQIKEKNMVIEKEKQRNAEEEARAYNQHLAAEEARKNAKLANKQRKRDEGLARDQASEVDRLKEIDNRKRKRDEEKQVKFVENDDAKRRGGAGGRTERATRRGSLSGNDFPDAPTIDLHIEDGHIAQGVDENKNKCDEASRDFDQDFIDGFGDDTSGVSISSGAPSADSVQGTEEIMDTSGVSISSGAPSADSVQGTEVLMDTSGVSISSGAPSADSVQRSEEHTSELQSPQ